MKQDRRHAKFLLLIFLCLISPARGGGGGDDRPTIDKPSVQVTLQTHLQYYKNPNGEPDQSVWSWTPRIKFRVNGPIEAGSQLSVEYTLPGNKPWVKYDCETREIGQGFWWEPECGWNLPDQQAVVTTGEVGLKILIRNELQGTSGTLFSGSFRVEKFHHGLDLAQFKNDFVFYVDYDWDLPIGYVFPADYASGQGDPVLCCALWFKGNDNASRNVAGYLFYNGKEVASTTKGRGTVSDEVSDLASQESPNEFRRRRFWFGALVADEHPEFHPDDFPLYKNPGDYEIKILQNGSLTRILKFSIGPDGTFVDNGVAGRNALGTSRLVVPVLVKGEQDGKWKRDSYKTDAFFRNPLADFTAP